MKIAIQFHRIGPYHAARLRGLVEAGVDVVAIELSGKDNTYAWEDISGIDSLNKITVFPGRDSDEVRADELERKLFEVYSSVDADVFAVNGWATPAAHKAMQWCAQHCVPAIVMSESTPWDFKRSFFKEKIKQSLLKYFSAALVGGEAHRDYLVSLGFPKDAVFLGYNAVDNKYFADEAAARRLQAEDFRRTNKLKSRSFLASGRFIEKKNFLRLVEAYADYRKRAGESGWDLVILGDGEERTAVETLVSNLNIAEHVHLPGFKQIDELPSWYAATSAFIHVSTTEQWGLVVNEAMASGLPVIVSERCGCACELVESGKNGWLVDPYSTSAIADTMLQMTALDVSQREAMGERSSKIIDDFGPKRFGEGFKAAAKYAISNQVSEVSTTSNLLLKCLRRVNRVRAH